MALVVGIDTGGTFTDLIAFDPQTGRLVQGKALTSYANIMDGIRECVRRAGVSLAQAGSITHGTTHVINAYLQRQGAKTALVTTRGFRDSLEIGRANRPTGFQMRLRRLPPLVPRHLRFEAEERMDASGQVLQPLELESLETVARAAESEGVEALAVSFLNAYRNAAHEQQAAQWLKNRLPGIFVTSAVELSREWFEFERTSTAVANAFVGPALNEYLRDLENGLAGERFAASMQIMGSNGGTMSVERARVQPVTLVESGPIGGCIGAASFAQALGVGRMIAFDMGGTTAKCALIEDCRFEIQPTYFVGGYDRGFPVRTAVLDIVEVGAGGGSIAAVDDSGRLRVGPRSAGSTPGPAAFGRGGTEPTVTDANLHLGRIAPGAFLNGALSCDLDAAAAALEQKVAAPLGLKGGNGAEQAASGILEIAVAAMSGAIKEITVDRGRDARDYTLFAFGGGGPLHASALARELHIRSVIIPPQPGNFSAAGMLMADMREDVQQTLLAALDEPGVEAARDRFNAMEKQAAKALRDQGAPGPLIVERKIDLRFKGQRHCIAQPFDPSAKAASLRQAFIESYRERFGHTGPRSQVEIAALRVAVRAARHGLSATSMGGLQPMEKDPPLAGYREVYFSEAGRRLRTPVYRRERLDHGFTAPGPAVVEEYGSTTIIGPGDSFCVGSLRELRLSVGSSHA